MKNTFGQNIGISLFGESHGDAVGVVIDGLAPGTKIDTGNIDFYLSKRRPSLSIDTQRIEQDNYNIISGVFNGRSTGTPLTIIISNENKNSKSYDYGIARPSHSDYSAFCKYHGFEDYRGGAHFSGRVTAGLVAAAGIIIPALENKGINIATHILECCGIYDVNFLDENIVECSKKLKSKNFPVIDENIDNKILESIINISKEKDSVGGVIQTGITGVPDGLGEPWFDSVESLISHAVFSIGGVKGIEFGCGFKFKDLKGSQANDSFYYDKNSVVTKSNNNGGINGGITNGMPIVFNCVVKPTPSIGKEQKTIDFINNKNTSISIQGRHDPAIIRRICPVVDSVVAIVLYDLMIGRYGTDFMTKS